MKWREFQVFVPLWNVVYLTRDYLDFHRKLEEENEAVLAPFKKIIKGLKEHREDYKK